ncbi:MAG: hypothetical protein IJI45_08195, partial [Anaerolineaceae bacterium]|nr:hypothetical protein [Anaerolineaceae bacterium]
MAQRGCQSPVQASQQQATRAGALFRLVKNFTQMKGEIVMKKMDKALEQAEELVAKMTIEEAAS